VDLGPSYVTASANFTHPAGDFEDGRVTFKVNSNPIQLARLHTAQEAKPGLAGALQLAADGAATLTAITARSIARSRDHVPLAPARWLVTGGGRHNPALMVALHAEIDAPVAAVEEVGWDGDGLEAQAFAFLAVRSLKGLPITFPETTGAPGPLTGGRLHLP
jgi:1,6-anhydro-N-acetylmuramate kinase